MTLRWFIPAWNGDFRLEPIEPGYRESESDKCQLVIEKPTVAEQDILGRFLTQAKSADWTAREAIHLQGESMRDVIPLCCSIGDAGQKLVDLTKPKDRTITAFRYEGGHVHVAESSDPAALAAAVEKAEDQAKSEDVSAASISRPTPCCPQCYRDAVGPATDVLLAFLTDEQHAQWRDHRALICRGGQSGHRYLIAHRHSVVASRIGRVCFDLDDGIVMHFHDWSVPPEEEVLASMLILQHREPWLRNQATALIGPLGRGPTDVYENPFGDIRDGTESTGFSAGFGQALLAILPQEGER